MSNVKDAFEILEKSLALVLPYLQKTKKDIQLYKDLKEQTSDPQEKQEYDSKIKELLVYKATKGSGFTDTSLRDFNKRFPYAQLHSHHYKFMTEQENRLLRISRNLDGNITNVESIISKEQMNEDEMKNARNIFLGFFIMLIPTFLESSLMTSLFSKYIPIINQLIENKTLFSTIVISSILASIFIVIRSIKNVFDIYTLQELIKYKVIQEIPTLDTQLASPSESVMDQTNSQITD
ncbi:MULTISPECIES: hypothetical protein [Acinetobacter]|uniref:hypothetical protein n=1 Tax=Acinetobacter TaxID=469 RepID=UPI001FBB34E0|nr:hypothetical protein [Acinetobacter sp. NyZ410]UOH19378.1 hypothetical protein MTO68_04150 [Acinetobacter sp. NyZ410]